MKTIALLLPAEVSDNLFSWMETENEIYLP
jgi:hypothetical protein